MARIKGAPSRKSLASVMMPGMALLAFALKRRDYGGGANGAHDPVEAVAGEAGADRGDGLGALAGAEPRLEIADAEAAMAGERPGRGQAGGVASNVGGTDTGQSEHRRSGHAMRKSLLPCSRNLHHRRGKRCGPAAQRLSQRGTKPGAATTRRVGMSPVGGSADRR